MYNKSHGKVKVFEYCFLSVPELAYIVLARKHSNERKKTKNELTFRFL